MKIITKLLAAIIICGANSLAAQKTFVDGAPISDVDAMSKTVSTTIGVQNFDGIKLSDDGTRVFAYRELFKQIFVIDAVSNNILDTISFTNNIWDFVPGNTNYLYYTENPTSFIYQLDLTTKQVVDSVALNQSSSAYLRRRPGTNEVWVTKENQLYYFTLNSMTLTPVNTGFSSNAWINTVEFNKTGSKVFMFAKAINQNGELKKMDASTKTIDGVLTTASSRGNLKYLTPSDDDSTLYINFWGEWPNEPSHIMFANSNTMNIYDSLYMSFKPFNMFETPNGDELWVVFHYNAKIGVLDRMNNLTIIDTIDVGTNPKNVLFTGLSTEVKNQFKSNLEWNIYPNPSSDFITIENKNRGVSNVKIFNTMGQEIDSFTMINYKKMYSLDNIPQGVYFIQITCDNEEVGLKKFIKN